MIRYYHCIVTVSGKSHHRSEFRLNELELIMSTNFGGMVRNTQKLIRSHPKHEDMFFVKRANIRMTASCLLDENQMTFWVLPQPQRPEALVDKYEKRDYDRFIAHIA